VRLQPLFVLYFITSWMTGMYCTASPPLMAEPFSVPDPFEDAPESSLSWGECFEWAEWEEVAQAMAPVPAPPAPSVLRWVAFQPRSDSTDCRPILRDLDVITAVRGIRSDQAAYVAKSVMMESW